MSMSNHKLTYFLAWIWMQLHFLNVWFSGRSFFFSWKLPVIHYSLSQPVIRKLDFLWLIWFAFPWVPRAQTHTHTHKHTHTHTITQQVRWWRIHTHTHTHTVHTRMEHKLRCYTHIGKHTDTHSYKVYPDSNSYKVYPRAQSLCLIHSMEMTGVKKSLSPHTHTHIQYNHTTNELPSFV